MVIYLITNKVNGMMYVGQTRYGSALRRYSQHLSYAYSTDPKRIRHTKLYEAMRKYERDNFKVDILEEVGSKGELNSREVYWIDKLGTLHPGGYNLTKGGDHNPMDSQISLDKHNTTMAKPEVRRAISEGVKKYLKDNPGVRKGRPAWNKGLTKASQSSYERKSSRPKSSSRTRHKYHQINGHLHPDHQRILIESRYKKYQCIFDNGDTLEFESGKEATLFWAKYLGNTTQSRSSRYKSCLRHIRRLISSGAEFRGCKWTGGTH